MIKNYLSILAENGELILAEIAVAPLVGAWIETARKNRKLQSTASLSLRERGLKLIINMWWIGEQVVAPFVGAWIKTPYASFQR